MSLKEKDDHMNLQIEKTKLKLQVIQDKKDGYKNKIGEANLKNK